MISTPCHSYLQSFLEGTLRNAAKNPVFFCQQWKWQCYSIADLHNFGIKIWVIQLYLDTFNMAFIKFLNFKWRNEIKFFEGCFYLSLGEKREVGGGGKHLYCFNFLVPLQKFSILQVTLHWRYGKYILFFQSYPVKKNLH